MLWQKSGARIVSVSLLSILLNVCLSEFCQVWCFSQANLLRFFFGGLYRPPIAQHSADHPERADSNGRGAMNEHRTVRGIISDLQELRRLFFFRVAVHDRDVEVPEAKFP